MTSDSIGTRVSKRQRTGTGDGIVHPADCRCFACHRPVSQEEFIQIQVRDQARIAELSDRIKTKLLQERDIEIEKIREESIKREATIRQEAGRAAEATLAPQIAKAKMDATLAAQQQINALKASQKALKESFERQVKVSEQQVKAALAKQSSAINAEKEKYFREKLGLEAKLQELQRRLQKKSANELGDEGELDLFQRLKNEFPNDQIERVRKGKQGADIIHRIIGPHGQIRGKILYDVKNTTRLLPKYLTKLRADQLREEADHGVLSTQACTQQLAVRGGVVIVHPTRAIAVAHLLRHQVLQVYGLRLGSAGRAEKAQQLYTFMLSDIFSHSWNEILDAANELDAIDRSEKISHERIWAQRAGLIHHVKEAHRSLTEAIDRIIGATGSEASP
jgi:hypothetical protein